MSSARPQFKLSALKRKNRTLSEINAWGFAGVMLALLFVLMPGPPDENPKGVDLVVALHSTSMPGAMKEDEMHDPNTSIQNKSSIKFAWQV
jgi:hypothetical protein